MPRKKKIADKDVNEKNKDKEKALDELAVRLKLNKENLDLEKHEKESELEEDVDDSNLNLQSLEFHQFMELQEGQNTSAPILERIAGSQPRPIFVSGIPRGTETSSNNNDSGDEFRYVPGSSESTEPKYFSEPGTNAPERIDLAQAGRTGSFREEISQERFFMQSEPKIESQSMERFERPKRFDVERAGRENSPERPETKYEKYTENMSKLQTYVAGLSNDTWTQNLYWGWLNALRPLITDKPEGYPSFMRNSAWARKELSTFLGSWTELKHDTILCNINQATG